MSTTGSAVGADHGLRFLDPDDRKQRAAWDELVLASPGGTVFHSTAWMDVIHKGLGLEPRFSYLAGPNGSVRALVPLFRAGGWVRSVRWVNLPQSCPSDPLASSASEAQALLEQLTSAAATQGAPAVVLRTTMAFRPTLPVGWEARREEPTLRHVLNLVGADDIARLPRCQTRLRRTVRQLRKTLPARGVQVRRIRPGEGRQFARAFHHILLRSHGHLGYPAQFFEAMLEFLPEATRLLIVETAEGFAQAIVFCLWSPSCSHCIYCVGLPTDEGKDAARLGMAEEMTAAMRAGLQAFDLGETGPQQNGLIDYKERWGAERTDGSYLVLARQGASSGLRVLGKNFSWVEPMLRRVPVTLTMAVAGAVHRNLQ